MKLASSLPAGSPERRAILAGSGLVQPRTPLDPNPFKVGWEVKTSQGNQSTGFKEYVSSLRFYGPFAGTTVELTPTKAATKWAVYLYSDSFGNANVLASGKATGKGADHLKAAFAQAKAAVLGMIAEKEAELKQYTALFNSQVQTVMSALSNPPLDERPKGAPRLWEI